MNKIFGGRYEVLEQIGAGGMAIVYKAKDVLLNRVVTIKVLREQFIADEDFIRRFRREAQSAASLSHPNIVSIYDVGKDGDTEYIVMEYVEGRNLKEIIRDFAPLSTDQSINLARQITSAIQNAHEHHIIHRDIKPHNILVTADGVAKVTDFGIARAVSSATVTHTGDIIGSVHYLSPEQAKGLQSNEQSDIYSLGIVLYELLTGKVPYDGETPIAIALKHLQEHPVLPSKINPRIEKEFESVIMRAIAKSLEKRYLSAKDLLEDLNHIQAGRPITRLETPEFEDPDATRIHKGMSKVLAPIDVKDPLLGKNSPPQGLNQKRKRLVVGGLVLLFLLLGGTVWALTSYITVGSTKVPNLIGQTVPVAGDYVKQAKLKLNPNVTYEFSDKVEKDRIADQNPKADVVVKVNREIQVVVSKGPDTGKFPDVTTGNLSKVDALNMIQNAGFTGKITTDTKPSDTVPKDYVAEQDPLPNATWPKNGDVHLTLSSGPQYVTINMPNVIGKTSNDAKTILEQNKLVVLVETQDSTDVLPDVVISTTPNPGEALHQGDQVTMIVSRGPGPVAQGIEQKAAMLAQILGIQPKKSKSHGKH
ncbi:MAG: Stk1 family PASTA domain-containing Ser/Thr kinase [Bacillota bacterium]|nr:Stk1 family PASTA domain-containing Ser/Thr kinase [Bacillota bacterium]